MTYQELGQFIKQERKKLKLTQKELADLAEVSFRTIQNIEKGDRISEKILNKILEVLNYTAIVNIEVKSIKK